MRNTAVVDSPRGHGLHAHLSWIFDEAAELRAAAVEFFDEGAALGARLVYGADRPVDELVGDLGSLPGRDRLLSSDGLAVLCLTDPEGPACSLHPVPNASEELVPFSAFAEGDGLALWGEVDALSADLLEQALAATPPGPAVLRIDLSRLRFVDAAAFATIASYAAAVSKAGGEVVVTGARPIVRRLAEVVGCEGPVRFVDTPPGTSSIHGRDGGAR